jgi:hypothetical protein
MKAIQAFLMLAFTLGAFELSAQTSGGTSTTNPPKPKETEKPCCKTRKDNCKCAYERSKPHLNIGTIGRLKNLSNSNKSKNHGKN